MSKKEDTELLVGKFFTGAGKALVCTAIFWGISLAIFAITGGDISNMSSAQSIAIGVGSALTSAGIGGVSAIAAASDKNKKKDARIAQLEADNVALNQQVVGLQNDNVDLTNQLNVANNTITTQQAELTAKNNEIQRLKNGAADIEAKASLAATFHGMAVGASDAAAKAAAEASELVAIEEIKTKANNLKS